MSTNKRPRKKYTPKLVIKPLGMRSAADMELPGYVASLALGQEFLQESHIYDLLSNADLTRRIAPDGHEILPTAQAMVEAIAVIQKRLIDTGKLGVTGDQFRVLREGLGKTLAFLRTASNYEIAAAGKAAVDEFNKTGYLRV